MVLLVPKTDEACPLLTFVPGIARAGNLDDANCNVEAVEFANSAQLSSIFEELLNTSYFRLFKVRVPAPRFRV